METDPHNVNNLAGDPKFKDVLLKLREVNHKWLIESRDVGFIPEAMIHAISQTQAPFDFGKSDQYPLDYVIETAEMASSRDESNLNEIVKRLGDKNAVVRYWAVIGTIVLKEDALSAKSNLVNLLEDTEIAVRIAASEALINLGDTERPVQVLSQALKSDNAMARVQALNVLEMIGKKAEHSFPNIRAIITDNHKDSDYDVRAAKRILDQAN